MRKIRDFMGGLGNRLFQYSFLHANVRRGNLPDIYLQDYRQFDEYRDELKEVFGITNNQTIQQVSLHIRRGDYINNPYYVDLTTTDYYQKAVEKFPDTTFLVFCHDNQGEEQDAKDKEWCKAFLDTFIKGRYTIHTPKTETEDLEDMALCVGHIMANSSFSFWASYLGGGKVVAPKQWFADGRSIPLPEEFIII